MFRAIWRHLTLLIAVSAFCGSMSTVAHAGTYDVLACSAAPGGSAASWSLVRTDASIASTTSCTAPGNPDAGLGLYTVPDNNLLSAPGAYASWQFNAPAGTTIDGVTADYEVVRRDQHAWWGGWGIGSALIPGQACLLNSAVLDCTIGTNPGSTAWIKTTGATNVNVVVGCSQAGDPWQCTHGWAHGLFGSQMAVIVRSAAVRVNDGSSPTLTVTGGGLTGGAGTVRGTESVNYRASDNVGIKGVSFAIDGVDRGSVLTSCDYTQRVPCPNVSGASQSFDSSLLSDGPHTLSVTATDTANNSKTAAASTFTVDNSAPAAPTNLQVVEGELWRSSPSYSLRWTNPGGQVSPIARAYYQLCPVADPDRCEEVQTQSATEISSLSGVRVPGEGDWLLRVYLEDAVGNVRPANASDPVHLRYDASAPDAPSNVSVDRGEGWRKDNRFDVRWANPAGQRAPIAAAHYELCDSAGSCQVGSVSGESLSGLRVPSRGDYSLSVWLEDEAGNGDRRNSNGAVHLRFDDAAPGLAAPATVGGWLTVHSLDEVVGMAPGADSPLSGIAGYSVTADGSEPDESVDTDGDGVFHIAGLPEGRTTIKARAVSGSGVASPEVGTAELRIDRTAPVTSVSGADRPDHWSAEPVTVRLGASDGLSGMSTGRISYSLDGGPSHNLEGDSAAIEVAEDGSHVVAFRAFDAAGNASPERTVTVLVDRSAPEVMLERPPVPAPAEITARVRDATSGVTRGVIEMRGADGWTALPTTLDHGRLVGRLDATRLVRRVYEFRASASDAAGNARASTELSDGMPLALLLGSEGELPAAAATPVAVPPQVLKPAPAKPVSKRCTKRARRGHQRGRRCAGKSHHKHRGGENKRHRHLGHRNHKKSRRHAG